MTLPCQNLGCWNQISLERHREDLESCRACGELVAVARTASEPVDAAPGGARAHKPSPAALIAKHPDLPPLAAIPGWTAARQLVERARAAAVTGVRPPGLGTAGAAAARASDAQGEAGPEGKRRENVRGPAGVCGLVGEDATGRDEAPLPSDRSLGAALAPSETGPESPGAPLKENPSLREPDGLAGRHRMKLTAAGYGPCIPQHALQPFGLGGLPSLAKPGIQENDTRGQEGRSAPVLVNQHRPESIKNQ